MPAHATKLPGSKPRCKALVMLAGLLLVAAAQTARAAEIEIRTQATCGAVIRLGDVADIFGGSAEDIARLKDVELGPAPRAGVSQWLTVREIQDALWRRNIDYVSHHFSGANRVEVKASVTSSVTIVEAGRTGQTPTVDRGPSEKLIASLVENFLRDFVDPQTDWQVLVNLTQAEAQIVSETSDWEIASAPRRPLQRDVETWLGSQAFHFAPRSARENQLNAGRLGSQHIEHQPLAISVDVSLPPTIVTLRYGVRAGTILTAGHVQCLPVLEGNVARGMESLRLEDVVGKEVTRALQEGQVLDRSLVRSPQLVKKQDPVTVVVVNGAVRLKAVGIALQNGAQGELIEVQSEFQKDHFQALVVGPATVELNLAGTPSPSAAPRGPLDVRTSPTRSTNTPANNESGANRPLSLPGRDAASRGGSSANQPNSVSYRGR